MSAGGSTDVTVPATLQAAIAARIDRLDSAAKQTLYAAAVIGFRFRADLLATLADCTTLAGLVQAELVDQVMFTPVEEYAFHQPLIRSVAYRSQLKAGRAALHRRVAAAIAERDPALAEENAALIAEHLELAGDLQEAFGWHMRAATWLTRRDVHAARTAWQRARQVADQLPGDAIGRAAMRISPRSLLCVTAWRVGCEASTTPASTSCTNWRPSPATRRRWPSAWPDRCSPWPPTGATGRRARWSRNCSPSATPSATRR